MGAIRSKGNRDTEMLLMRIFRKNKITGWRRNQKVFGHPDFVFWRERLAIFVDGCFWHGCPTHGRNPETNREYWLAKLDRNRKRDQEVTLELRRCGWGVLRLWEHMLSDPSQVVARCRRVLSKRCRQA